MVWERPPPKKKKKKKIRLYTANDRQLCMTLQPEARQLATLLSLAYPYCDVYKIQRLNDNLALSSKYILVIPESVK